MKAEKFIFLGSASDVAYYNEQIATHSGEDLVTLGTPYPGVHLVYNPNEAVAVAITEFGLLSDSQQRIPITPEQATTLFYWPVFRCQGNYWSGNYWQLDNEIYDYTSWQLLPDDVYPAIVVLNQNCITIRLQYLFCSVLDFNAVTIEGSAHSESTNASKNGSKWEVQFMSNDSPYVRQLRLGVSCRVKLALFVERVKTGKTFSYNLRVGSNGLGDACDGSAHISDLGASFTVPFLPSADIQPLHIDGPSEDITELGENGSYTISQYSSSIDVIWTTTTVTVNLCGLLWPLFIPTPTVSGSVSHYFESYQVSPGDEATGRPETYSLNTKQYSGSASLTATKIETFTVSKESLEWVEPTEQQ